MNIFIKFKLFIIFSLSLIITETVLAKCGDKMALRCNGVDPKKCTGKNKNKGQCVVPPLSHRTILGSKDVPLFLMSTNKKDMIANKYISAKTVICYTYETIIDSSEGSFVPICFEDENGEIQKAYVADLHTFEGEMLELGGKSPSRDCRIGYKISISKMPQ